MRIECSNSHLVASSVLLLGEMPGATSSFLLLVAVPLMRHEMLSFKVSHLLSTPLPRLLSAGQGSSFTPPVQPRQDALRTEGTPGTNSWRPESVRWA